MRCATPTLSPAVKEEKEWRKPYAECLSKLEVPFTVPWRNSSGLQGREGEGEGEGKRRGQGEMLGLS